MGRLIYLPLESYKERYTGQLSAPNTGWLERRWKQIGLNYLRVDPDNSGPKSIQSGQVLDAVGRGIYSLNQTSILLELLEKEQITDEDVVFLDDFWTPGIEAFFYACVLLNVRPKVYAYCWAQSVDKFDFTHQMRQWMRPIERGYATWYDGIFVASSALKELLVDNAIGTAESVHVVGLPFDSEEVMSRMPKAYREMTAVGSVPLRGKRRNNVVFSSRWDREKNPDFFMQVMESVLTSRPDTWFTICTSAPELRSNRPALLDVLDAQMKKWPGHIILKENLTKEQYYAVLAESKVQFNCADQDWVSFTLLEASVAGCYPIYPDYRSFPETFQAENGFLYAHKDVDSAAKKILGILAYENLWTHAQIGGRSWIHARYDTTWARMLNVMCPGTFKPDDARLFPVYPDLA